MTRGSSSGRGGRRALGDDLRPFPLLPPPAKTGGGRGRWLACVGGGVPQQQRSCWSPGARAIQKRPSGPTRGPSRRRHRVGPRELSCRPWPGAQRARPWIHREPADQLFPIGPAAFDAQSGRLVVVSSFWGWGDVQTTSFDVCTNTWASHKECAVDAGELGRARGGVRPGYRRGPRAHRQPDPSDQFPHLLVGDPRVGRDHRATEVAPVGLLGGPRPVGPAPAHCVPPRLRIRVPDPRGTGSDQWAGAVPDGGRGLADPVVLQPRLGDAQTVGRTGPRRTIRGSGPDPGRQGASPSPDSVGLLPRDPG